MSNYFYKKAKKKYHLKKIVHILAFGLLFVGLYILSYVFLPIISWSIYFAPAFASQNIVSPIPKLFFLGFGIPKMGRVNNTYYLNAQNWFPTYVGKPGHPRVSSYLLTIPKLSIENAIVSTIDNDLAHHLVQYQGTALPPDNGNAVIFGHSTLPQLFNPRDYTTIFANAYILKPGDTITLQMQEVTYLYKIYTTIVVDPTDTSVFNQDYPFSNLTLVTCTPPGTTWKRLIVKAKIENLTARTKYY